MTEGSLQAFLFVVDSTAMSRDDAIKIIDEMPAVVNWMKILPDAAVLVSEIGLSELHSALKEKLPGQRYLLTLLESGRKQGWLSKNAWEFMNKPTAV